MRRLDRLLIHITDTSKLTAFYCGVLGMNQHGQNCFNYNDSEMSLCFKAGALGKYEAGANDLYWKIAISVPDLDLAYQQLIDQGVDISPPRQFRDVGYLTSVTDPEGFNIELIQHGFEGDSPLLPVNPELLGGGPCVNLLTLRYHNIDQVNRYCIDELGMRPLSVQPVEPYGFTLYFYAFTEEQPPDNDLTAIANRSWTYSRPYTVLEVQHLHEATEISHAKEGTSGYRGTVISGGPIKANNPLGLIENDE